MDRKLHLDAMRAAKDSDHFWASSGCGRAENRESEFLRLKNNPDFRFKIRISELQREIHKYRILDYTQNEIIKSFKKEKIVLTF